ncbi:hypothetical protein N656DRAFT_783691 [Canariomyces notabilis]|uniref:Uncharacterized protein n=1 Tax=Canariomyces notabilis TaxID=2074819 RepID=A0AAN6QL46_9PEZI|nr:hypothetical protein N656DRAFT_783691 [Canariomyces arenarius]
MALSTTASFTTSFTASPTATLPIVAFTTPFPQPINCAPESLLTTTVSHYSGFGTTESETFLLPDTSDARYTACLAPAGSQFSFSPAVCPDGWPAWWLGSMSALSGTATTATPTHVSTAYCCAPGYSMPYENYPDDSSPSCEQAFLQSTSSTGDMFPSTWALSVAKVPAWHISWQPTDLPTLSPQPPAIEGDRITRWVPGSDPEREPRDNAWGGRSFNPGLFYFLVAGIPIIIVVAIVACLTGCFHPCNHCR